jgi:hypothetical protein
MYGSYTLHCVHNDDGIVLFNIDIFLVLNKCFENKNYQLLNWIVHSALPRQFSLTFI